MPESAAMNHPSVSGPLGAQTNPVRCDGIPGEIAYLSRLRNPDGSQPEFQRAGSFAYGVYGHVDDGYEVKGANGTVIIYMDMYHPGYIEQEVVPGFTLAGADENDLSQFTATSFSTDAFPPGLMKELKAAQRPFPAAYEALWRRERAFRYVYWLEHHEHPPCNLIGSWTAPDMNAEIALWQRMRRECLDDAAVIDLVTGDLEQRFGLSYTSLLERVSHPSLAELGLPVWNQPTESLIPQSLGKWRIAGMTEYPEPALGVSYAYHRPDVDAPLTLCVYDHGLNDLQSGLADPRFARALSVCIEDINTYASINQGEITWYVKQPVLELTKSRLGAEIPFASTTWLVTYPDRPQQVGALSLTAFRGHFFKLRITCSKPLADSDEGQRDIGELNLDLAGFLELFGP